MASPRKAHCFAIFTHLSGNEQAPAEPPRLISQFTISWLPATQSIRLLARPESGRNLTYAESLAWAARLGIKTISWGRLEIRKDGFDAALRQWHLLNSGQVAFKALDRRGRPNMAINCIHAISDIVPGPLLQTGTARGFGAGQMLVNHFRSLRASGDQYQLTTSPPTGQPLALSTARQLR